MTNTMIRIIIIAVLSVTILTAAETSVSLNRAMEIVSSARNAVSALPVLAGIRRIRRGSLPADAKGS